MGRGGPRWRLLSPCFLHLAARGMRFRKLWPLALPRDGGGADRRRAGGTQSPCGNCDHCEESGTDDSGRRWNPGRLVRQENGRLPRPSVVEHGPGVRPLLESLQAWEKQYKRKRNFPDAKEKK